MIAVKGNQPKLFHQLQATCAENQPTERFTDVEKFRNRVTCRIVSVFDDICKIDSEWSTVKNFVQVERIGIPQGKPDQQTNYYISSLAASAAQFAQIIRVRLRGIENRLHWVKDVVFKEDSLPLKHHNAARNWSLLRNVVINLARQHGYDSLTKAERFFSHNIYFPFFNELSLDGQTLISGSHDRTIKLWDVTTGQCLKTLEGDANPIWSVAISPNGSILASGSEDRTVKLWNVNTRECLKTLQQHTGNVSSVSFSPAKVRGYDLLASSAQDGTIKLWDVQRSTCLKTLRPPKPYEGMKITGVTGLTAAAIATLKDLGAVAL